MIWQSGDQCVLVHTGTKARISRWISNDMVMVIPEGDLAEIPIHIDDLARPGQKINPINDPQTQTAPASGRLVPSGKGLFIAVAMDPQEQMQRMARFFLANDTETRVSYSIKLDRASSALLTAEGVVDSHSWCCLYELPLDHLNDGPILHGQCWKQGTVKQEAFPAFSLKIRAAQVITRQQLPTLLPFEAAHFPLPASTEADPPTLPLKVHTSEAGSSHRRRFIHIPDPQERANFKNELDLHAEKLFADPHKVRESDIYARQLEVFERYLEQAIRLGVPRVYIIHGLGKGRLRNAIIEKSLANPHVVSARNYHHPFYGFGATEIILED